MKRKKKITKIVSVVGTKGGGGKTTISIHLAVAFAENGFQTLLIDTDITGSTISWEKRREYENLNLKVVSLPKSNSLASLIGDFVNDYEIIVIDGSPRPGEDIITVSITVADLVLIPVQPSGLDIWKILESVIGEIDRDLPIIKKQIGRIPLIYFSICRLKPRSRVAKEVWSTLKESFNLPTLKTPYVDRVAYSDSIGNGATVLQWDNEKAKKEVSKHYDEVRKLLRIR